MQASLLQLDEMGVWDTYVSAHRDATAYHRSGWRRIIERVFGRRTHYIVAKDANGELCGALPLVRLKSIMFGDFLVSLPYLTYGGVLADTSEAKNCLVKCCSDLAEELGVRHVELRHTEVALDLPTRTDRISMVLDLPEDSELLWKALGSKLRAQVKRPLREGATAVTGGVELLDQFYPIFARKYRQLGVPVYPKQWFAAILREFPDCARITVASLADRPAAAGLIIDHRDRAEVAWAASERDTDRLGGNMFLYWSMLKDAVARGRSGFDFGRTSEGSGTYRFKKQWGARPVPLYWQYILGRAEDIPQLNLDNPTYRRAAQLWSRLPLWATIALGPRLVRNLP